MTQMPRSAGKALKMADLRKVGAARSGVCANLLVAIRQRAQRSVMTCVYRYYDQSELERQLNARATVPDITPILMRYASESARMRSGLPCRLKLMSSHGRAKSTWPRPEHAVARPASCPCTELTTSILCSDWPTGTFAAPHRFGLLSEGLLPSRQRRQQANS